MRWSSKKLNDPFIKPCEFFDFDSMITPIRCCSCRSFTDVTISAAKVSYHNARGVICLVPTKTKKRKWIYNLKESQSHIYIYIYIYIFFLCIFCFREHVQCKTRHAFETNFDSSTIYWWMQWISTWLNSTCQPISCQETSVLIVYVLH